MARTSTRVQFGLYALAIKQDSTPSTASDLQPFSKVADLKTDNASSRPYASYEPDFWLLDGGYKFLPDDPDDTHVGLMSLEMSGATGDFADPPVLTVDFSEPHTTDGLSLRFSQYSGDWCSSLNVKYYDGAASLIRSDDYTPDGTEFTVSQTVEDFEQIVITFNSTNRPYRYLRLLGIDFGVLVTFEGSAIKGASVIEECDPLSAELRVNTLELALFSEDAQFSILNPEGYYAALQERQPLAVYEIVDGVSIFMGQYFLSDWKNTSDTETEFDAEDLLGLADKIPDRGGLWTGAGIMAGDLIQDILEAAGIPYELDPLLSSVAVIGWLPVGTVREALQQIAFAIGAQVDCSRSWALRIYPTRLAADETATATITKSQKGSEQSLTLRPQIAGVEVTAHKYVASNDTRELFDDTLAVGTYEILFRQPMHTLSVSGASIVESGVNYAILSVAAPGTVTLSGKLYVDTTQVYKIENPAVTGSIKPVLRVSDATLVRAGNVADVAQRVYDYHEQRYLQKLKLYAPSVEVGQCVLVDTLYSKQLRAVIEKMSIDLGSGMVARVELAGVENV